MSDEYKNRHIIVVLLKPHLESTRQTRDHHMVPTELVKGAQVKLINIDLPTCIVDRLLKLSCILLVRYSTNLSAFRNCLLIRSFSVCVYIHTPLNINMQSHGSYLQEVLLQPTLPHVVPSAHLRLLCRSNVRYRYGSSFNIATYDVQYVLV